MQKIKIWSWNSWLDASKMYKVSINISTGYLFDIWATQSENKREFSLVWAAIRCSTFCQKSMTSRRAAEHYILTLRALLIVLARLCVCCTVLCLSRNPIDPWNYFFWFTIIFSFLLCNFLKMLRIIAGRIVGLYVQTLIIIRFRYRNDEQLFRC